MKFDNILNEIKDGYKRLSSAAGGSSTPEKTQKYLRSLERSGKVSELKKRAKDKGLKGKDAESYKWAVIHKMMKGHFN